MISFLLIAGCALAACSSADNNGTVTKTGSVQVKNSSSGSATGGQQSVVITVTPAYSTPSSSTGTAGTGPLVVVSPTPVEGGKPGSQQVVLADRTLIIDSVSSKAGADANSTLITLAVTIKNTGAKAIMNQPAHFQLIGAEGDSFGLEQQNIPAFFGTIESSGTRSTTLSFGLPKGATRNLRLLYRADAGTALVSLNI